MPAFMEIDAHQVHFFVKQNNFNFWIKILTQLLVQERHDQRYSIKGKVSEAVAGTGRSSRQKITFKTGVEIEFSGTIL